MSEGSLAGADDLPDGFAAIGRLADYHLEERIGAGGMAVVFRARDERLQRHVALKVLAPALAGDEAFRQRFIRESQAAAAVDDPHIIPVFEAGEAEGVLFLAMRYVPGGDVRTLVRRTGPLSPVHALSVISSVASALDAAHSAGLVHRDVKLANILLDAHPGRPDHVYLSDFGLSKMVMSSIGPTRAGQFLGTPGYSAPEQLEGKPVDGRADQYSLACAAFELLCGQTPFPRDQLAAVIWAHISEPPPALTSRGPIFHRLWTAFCRRRSPRLHQTVTQAAGRLPMRCGMHLTSCLITQDRESARKRLIQVPKAPMRRIPAQRTAAVRLRRQSSRSSMVTAWKKPWSQIRSPKPPSPDKGVSTNPVLYKPAVRDDLPRQHPLLRKVLLIQRRPLSLVCGQAAVIGLSQPCGPGAAGRS